MDRRKVEEKREGEGENGKGRHPHRKILDPPLQATM